MIYLEKNTINTVALSLTESSTLENPFYLFVFENEFDTAEDPVFFYTPDLSLYKDRYNLFQIEEGTPDLTLVKGQYTYKIYEAVSQPATIEDTTGQVIEQGRMIVSSDVITFNSIYD